MTNIAEQKEENLSCLRITAAPTSFLFGAGLIAVGFLGDNNSNEYNNTFILAGAAIVACTVAAYFCSCKPGNKETNEGTPEEKGPLVGHSSV